MERGAARAAGPGDAADIGRLLHAFNTEYDDPTPPVTVLAERVPALPDTRVLLIGEPAHGIAVLRFRPGLWSERLECYLAELYVEPPHRGHGAGRALMEATLDLARAQGAGRVDLGTSEDDAVARALYESCGFTNREGPGGPIMYVYERDL